MHPYWFCAEKCIFALYQAYLRICDPLQEKGPSRTKIRNCIITTCTQHILLQVERYQNRQDPSFLCGVMAASVLATPEQKNTLQFQTLNFTYSITLAHTICLCLLSSDYSPHGRVARWSLALCGGMEELFCGLEVRIYKVGLFLEAVILHQECTQLLVYTLLLIQQLGIEL